MTYVGSWLRKRRQGWVQDGSWEKRGITTAQLAHKIGVSTNATRTWERNRNENYFVPNLSCILKLEKFFKTDPDRRPILVAALKDMIIDNDKFHELNKTKPELVPVMFRILALPRSELLVVKRALDERYGSESLNGKEPVLKQNKAGEWVMNKNYSPTGYIQTYKDLDD